MRRRARQSTARTITAPHRRRWLRAAAWFTALLLAATASVVALSKRAQAVELQPYQPSPELAGALLLEPDLAHGSSLYRKHCASCHAKDAWGSTDGRTPALAGQHYEYLVKQIADLRRGQDREGAGFHRVLAGVLEGNQDIADVAAYLFHLEPNPQPRTGSGDWLRLGGTLYGELCGDCHQDRGEGYGIFFIPRISGQHYPYLLQQLEAFAQGHRLNAPPEVLDLAATLSTRERAALADYIARLAQSEVIDVSIDSSR